jgi:hypothetical protein
LLRNGFSFTKYGYLLTNLANNGYLSLQSNARIIKVKITMVQYAGKTRLQADFSRLSEDKKSEILGMAEAFTYAQRLGGPELLSRRDGGDNLTEKAGRPEDKGKIHGEKLGVTI